ncbi:hypothetical protein ACJMK2_009148 [Sinanodonta woodiana]|uniref:Ubiquitin-like domain-containing protein n=1 Tax=Sinanodonta woodiana TaxID=1069815 RepID=A0ABD3VBD4_SINWO
MDLDSVTLVIKAPNQRFEDHTVECMLGWTVGKLKRHLQDVYPSKPKLHQQKLIYSGKLLKDDLTLKEILHKYDDGSNRHTVHLVCSPTFPSVHSDNYSSNRHDKDRQESQWSPRETSGNTNFLESDGLRYRGTQTSFTTVTGNSQNAGHTMPQIPQYPSVPMMPAAGMMYTPEQYLYMQQVYAQYMAQYMQQYYQAGWQQQQTPPITPATPGQPVNLNQDERVAANENVRMDAGAGAAVADDDDEFGQRDWLDYIYTFSRLLVLIGIVYFYSTPSRFLMVIVCFFVVYLYQAGWFQLRRENNNNQQQQQQQLQNQQQQAQQGSDQPVENRENPGENEENDSLAQPNSPPVPAGPSILSIMWTFISTFFLSLVPQQPPAVNAN